MGSRATAHGARGVSGSACARADGRRLRVGARAELAATPRSPRRRQAEWQAHEQIRVPARPAALTPRRFSLAARRRTRRSRRSTNLRRSAADAAAVGRAGPSRRAMPGSGARDIEAGRQQRARLRDPLRQAKQPLEGADSKSPTSGHRQRVKTRRACRPRTAPEAARVADVCVVSAAFEVV